MYRLVIGFCLLCCTSGPAFAQYGGYGSGLASGLGVGTALGLVTGYIVGRASAPVVTYPAYPMQPYHVAAPPPYPPQRCWFGVVGADGVGRPLYQQYCSY